MKTTFPVVIIVCVIAIVLMTCLIKSRHGRNMIAIREEELASQAIGINVFKYKMISFVISAAFAAIGGVLYAHYLGYQQYPLPGRTDSNEIVTSNNL